MRGMDRLRKRVLLRLQQLDMFLILVESGSIRGTADTAGLSQSAVSKSLKELEGMLRTQLFTRSPSGLKPTSAAGIFERFARQSIRGYNQMVTDLARESGGDLYPMYFGTMRGLPQKLLNDALAQAKRRYGHVLVRIHMGTSESLSKRVIDGEQELAVMHVPPQSDRSGLRCFTVGMDALVAIALPGHPVFAGAAALHDFPWSIPSTTYQLRHDMEKAILVFGTRWPRQVIEYESFAIDLELMQDDTILWTTRSVAESWLEQGLLKPVPIPFPAPAAKIGCFRAAGRQLSLAAVVVWRELVAASRKGGKAAPAASVKL